MYLATCCIPCKHMTVWSGIASNPSRWEGWGGRPVSMVQPLTEVEELYTRESTRQLWKGWAPLDSPHHLESDMVHTRRHLGEKSNSIYHLRQFKIFKSFSGGLKDFLLCAKHPNRGDCSIQDRSAEQTVGSPLPTLQVLHTLPQQ